MRTLVTCLVLSSSVVFAQEQQQQQQQEQQQVQVQEQQQVQVQEQQQVQVQEQQQVQVQEQEQEQLQEQEQEQEQEQLQEQAQEVLADDVPDALRRSRAHANPWSAGTPRAFFAASFDVGFLYLRPRLSVGYGKPHELWIGWDANPIVNISAAGAYTGLRLHHPFADLRVGARYGVAYSRSYFEPQRSYLARDFGIDNGSTASYLSWEAELTLQIPAGRVGRLVSESALTYVSRVPSTRYVLEETIRVIVDPPWVWRTRLGYLFRFGAENAIQIGIVAELVGVPKRDLTVLRAGLVLNWNVTPKIQIRGSWIPTIHSRDQLGIRGGYFGTLGVRWRWATGMPDTPEQDLRCTDC